MAALLRVAIAAVNEGNPAVAEELVHEFDVAAPFRRLIDGEGPAELDVRGHVITRVEATSASPTMVAMDGTSYTMEELSLAELATAVRTLVMAMDDAPQVGSLEDFVEALDSDLERARIRLLLEDVLFEPSNRAIALDRLERHLSRFDRDTRDVEHLFDA